MIEGVGPRYCPSIEDKIVRFAEKKRHQLFIEPCGMDTEEMYLQGNVLFFAGGCQIAFYRSIKGLEHVQIMRSAYAIEYDCVDPPKWMRHWSFGIPGLYGASQFNGSSGYEEAAAQGICRRGKRSVKAAKKPPLIFGSRQFLYWDLNWRPGYQRCQ